VIIIALSGVALSPGAVCGVVCVLADEFKLRQPASTAIASSNPLLRRIAFLLQDILTIAGIEGRSSPAKRLM